MKSFLMSLTALTFLLALGCGDDNYLDSFSNDDSSAACQYQVSMALDSGLYDLVIASPCANFMDLAAAHLGLAGFDIVNIINVMIEANDSGDQPLDVYMNKLVGNVSNADIRNLDYSLQYYSLVNTANGYTTGQEKDAQFLSGSLISPVISFAYIKASIDPDGDGNVSSCDLNGNNLPDEVDATDCALLVAAGVSDCSGMGITTDDITYKTLSFPSYTSLYNGITMDFGGVTNATCPDNMYYQLLFSSSYVAVTSMEKCVDPNYPTIEWNCPYEDSAGQPADLLGVFNDSMQDSLSILNSLGFDSSSEVYAAVNTISADACGSPGSSCTAQQFQAYLESQFIIP